MDTKAIADSVAAKHGTRNPFCIAEDLGFIVVFARLFETRGMRQFVKRRVIFYINSDLDERQRQIVCAHELGHHFLHRGMNHIFMDRNTCMVTSKYENEAHHFSVDLLFDDCELTEFLELPVSKAAAYMGVTDQLAKYRMQSVEPRLF
ncbi:hypothetical protein OBV_43300 [Oscillibacter valericigenes Sjm18-20]|nr:hypothetical protein OBV_43300 [Oscillibacter valericigenes Sjm18-20]